MAQKRKRTVAKKPTRKAGKALFKPSRPSFNKRNALLVVLLFVAVGVYFIIRSLAAEGTLLTYTDFVGGDTNSPGSVLIQETGSSKRNAQVVEITSGPTSKALYRSATKGLTAGSYKTCFIARSLSTSSSGAFTVSRLNGGTVSTLVTRNFSLAPVTDYQATGCVNFNLATATAGLQAVITNASGGKLRVSTISFEKTADPQPTTDCGSNNSDFTPSGMRPIPCALHGVTVDRVDGLANIIASSRAFQKMPTTRIVFDGGASVNSYNTAINQMQPDSYLMGELLDSYEENKPAHTLSQQTQRAKDFLAAYGDKIDIWEVGNEVNGNWTGPYQSVADKIVARYNVMKNAGKRTALTLWENTYAPNHCGNGNNELTGAQFSSQYMPENVRNGLNYVFLSWYPSQCRGLTGDNVPAATIKAEIEQLHALYPNALIGFGEIGLPKKAVTATQDNTKRLQDMVDYYYALSPHIDLPYYTGGYFYWYYWEDALPHTTKPIWQNLNNGFGKY